MTITTDDYNTDYWLRLQDILYNTVQICTCVLQGLLTDSTNK